MSVPRLGIAKSVVCYLQMGWFCFFSRGRGLQRALNSFANAWDTAGMKISAAKSETYHLSRTLLSASYKWMESHWSRQRSLSILGLSSWVMIEGKTKNWIPKLVGLLQWWNLCTIRWSWNENCQKGKVLNFQNNFCPHFHFCHESWVMTERVQSLVQASKMWFLGKIERVRQFIKVSSSKIRKSPSRYLSGPNSKISA